MTTTRPSAALVVALAVAGIVGVGAGAAWGLAGSIPTTLTSGPSTGSGQEFAPGSVNDTVFVGDELDGLLLTPEQIEGTAPIGDYYFEVDNTFTSPVPASECSVFDGDIDRFPAGYRQQYGSNKDEWSAWITWVRNEAFQFPTIEEATARFDEIVDLTDSCNHYVGARNSLDDEAPADVVFGPITDGEAPSVTGTTTIYTADADFFRRWAIVRAGNVITVLIVGHPVDAPGVSDDEFAALVELLRSRAVDAAATVGSSDD